jgi:hypothetical protein
MLMPKAPLFFRLFGWTLIGDSETIVLTLVQVAAIPGRPFADDEGSRRERWSRRTPKSAKSNPYCFASAVKAFRVE